MVPARESFHSVQPARGLAEHLGLEMQMQLPLFEAAPLQPRLARLSRLAFGLRRDLRLAAGEIPVSLSVEAGQNWAGGQALSPSLTLAMQRRVAAYYETGQIYNEAYGQKD